MALRDAPAAYDQRDQQELRNEIERLFNVMQRKDQHLRIRQGTYIIVTDANGQDYSLTVNTSGVLVVTSL